MLTLNTVKPFYQAALSHLNASNHQPSPLQSALSTKPLVDSFTALHQNTRPVQFGLFTEQIWSVTGGTRHKSLKTARIDTQGGVALTTFDDRDADKPEQKKTYFQNSKNFKLHVTKEDAGETVTVFKNTIPVAKITNAKALELLNLKRLVGGTQLDQLSKNAKVEVFVGKDGGKFITASFGSPSAKGHEFLWHVPEGSSVEFSVKGKPVKIEVFKSSTDKSSSSDPLYGDKPGELVKLNESEKDVQLMLLAAGSATRAMPIAAAYAKQTWPATSQDSLPGSTIALARELGFEKFFIHTGKENDARRVLNGIRRHLVDAWNPNSLLKIGEFQEGLGSGTAVGLVNLYKSTFMPGIKVKSVNPQNLDNENTPNVPFNKTIETIIVAGDALLSQTQLVKLLRAHREHNASITVAMVPIKDHSRVKEFGTVLTENPGQSGKITEFFEKVPYDGEMANKFDHNDPTANTSIYVISPEVYPLLEAIYKLNDVRPEFQMSSPQKIDFGGDVLPILAQLQHIQEETEKGAPLEDLLPVGKLSYKNKKMIKAFYLALGYFQKREGKRIENENKSSPHYKKLKTLYGERLEGYWDDVGSVKDYGQRLASPQVNSDLVVKEGTAKGSVVMQPNGGNQVLQGDVENFALRTTGNPVLALKNVVVQ